MKRLALLFALTFLASITLKSQSCLPEGITFSTQAQIDSFQINYPNCTEIEGFVEIGGHMTNLAGLSVLTSIGEGLYFQQTDSLINMTGLENLTYIGGSLWIFNNNASLTDLNGLNNLTSIGGGLDIGNYYDGNPVLTSLTGLNGLTSIGGRLWIMENPMLNDISGLLNVTSIGDNLEIRSNNSLTNLTGLDNINSGSITNLNISNNSSLSDCEVQVVCDYLSDPNGIIEIYNNAYGCNNPPQVANSCGFTLSCLPYGNYYFHSQTEIDSFQYYYPDCSHLEGAVLISGSDISSLSGLDQVTSIGEGVLWSLCIRNTDSLVNLIGLDNLTTVAGNFAIGYQNYPYNGNSSLLSLTGLESLVSIEGDLRILDNDTLTNLSGLNNLTTIGGNLSIAGNEYLENLVGLENLNNISGGFLIGQVYQYSNPSLTDLSGLMSLTTIGGGLRINAHPSLVSIAQLENVTTIGGLLEIKGNDILNSLAGLDNINENTIEDLQIVANDLLSTCEVQSICEYLAAPHGTIQISYNALGCNSQEEVDSACNVVGIDEICVLEKLSIHPNPFSTSTTIEYELSQAETVTISFYNQFGKQVDVIEHKQLEGLQRVIWTPENLADGIYYFRIATGRLQAGEQVATGKMVLMR